jgi:hypothetical protein
LLFDDLLDLVANIALALERNHVLKARAGIVIAA